ncbi:MAG: hypothetical protein O7F73_17340, partial [Gammaproteobacteria bacterium]|nr:hypothetical protein [Gammaproteobacteria bacterium]
MQADAEAAEFLTSIPGRGAIYADKYQYFHAHWQGHVDASRRAILQGAAQAAGAGVTVLGAGDCKEIPIVELLERFDHITLVDVDEESLGRMMGTLSPVQQQRVRPIVKDLTAGAVLALTGTAARVIERASTPRQAYRGLVEVYANVEISDFSADDLRDLQSGYVVSSVVASQLLPFPELWIAQQFEVKFKKKLKDVLGEKYASAKLALHCRMLQQHARLLTQLAPTGLVYWSCDVRQELVMGKLSSAHTQQLGQQMTEYLGSIDWGPSGLELEVDPTAGGQFTAYLTSLIGKGHLPPPLELQIIEYMVNAAQSL